MHLRCSERYSGEGGPAKRQSVGGGPPKSEVFSELVCHTALADLIGLACRKIARHDFNNASDRPIMPRGAPLQVVEAFAQHRHGQPFSASAAGEPRPFTAGLAVATADSSASSSLATCSTSAPAIVWLHREIRRAAAASTTC